MRTRGIFVFVSCQDKVWDGGMPGMGVCVDSLCVGTIFERALSIPKIIKFQVQFF